MPLRSPSRGPLRRRSRSSRAARAPWTSPSATARACSGSPCHSRTRASPVDASRRVEAVRPPWWSTSGLRRSSKRSRRECDRWRRWMPASPSRAAWPSPSRREDCQRRVQDSSPGWSASRASRRSLPIRPGSASRREMSSTAILWRRKQPLRSRGSWCCRPVTSRDGSTRWSGRRVTGGPRCGRRAWQRAHSIPRATRLDTTTLVTPCVWCGYATGERATCSRFLPPVLPARRVVPATPLRCGPTRRTARTSVASPA